MEDHGPGCRRASIRLVTTDFEEESLHFCDLDDCTAGCMPRHHCPLYSSFCCASRGMACMRRPPAMPFTSAYLSALRTPSAPPICMPMACSVGMTWEDTRQPVLVLHLITRARWARCYTGGVPHSILAACRQPELDLISKGLPTNCREAEFTGRNGAVAQKPHCQGGYSVRSQSRLYRLQGAQHMSGQRWAAQSLHHQPA